MLEWLGAHWLALLIADLLVGIVGMAVHAFGNERDNMAIILLGLAIIMMTTPLSIAMSIGIIVAIVIHFVG